MNGHFLRSGMYTTDVVQKEKGYDNYSGCTNGRVLSFIKFRVNEETVATTGNRRVVT